MTKKNPENLDTITSVVVLSTHKMYYIKMLNIVSSLTSGLF